MGPGPNFVKSEVHAVAHRSMQDAQPKQSIRLSAIRLHELNMQKEKTKLIAELCRNAKAALDLSVTFTDVCDVLMSFLQQLRKTEVGLRLLNEEMEHFST